MIREMLGSTSLNEAEDYFRALKSYQVDPAQDFQRVKGRIGLMASITYAQMFFTNQNTYKRLRRELDLHQRESNPLNQQFDVLIVLPPRGTLNKRALENFRKQSLGLSMSAGFAHVSHAQLNSDRVLHGAHRLLKLVAEKKSANRKLIIVSYSYGSAFVRAMLDQCQADEISHVKGWVNLSGLIFGSPLFDCSDKRGLLSRTSAAQRTFSSEQRYFLRPLQTHHLKVVHFLGMKNSESLSRREYRERERLRAWGPNDGVVCFSRYQKLEQPVVPLGDQGHLLNLAYFSSTFVRTLSSIVSTIPMAPVHSTLGASHLSLS